MSPRLALSWLCKAAPLPLLLLSSLSTLGQMEKWQLFLLTIMSCAAAMRLSELSFLLLQHCPTVFLCCHSTLAHLTTVISHH
jgi:hypothetical protein